MNFYSNPMDIGMINYPDTYRLFMSEKNFSYFSIPDFWELKQKVYTSSYGETLQNNQKVIACTDLKVTAHPYVPKSSNLTITGDIVNNLNNLVNNKIVFQSKQSEFFDFTDSSLCQSLE